MCTDFGNLKPAPCEGSNMDVRIQPSRVAGTVTAPPSKSYSHRAILAGGLADTTDIQDTLVSADTKATMRAITGFGATIDRTDGCLTISGCNGNPQTPDTVLDCANSGTTMRLVMGTASLVDGITVLTGDDSLRDRPQGPLLTALGDLGASVKSTRGNGKAPVIIEGPMQGGPVSIPGDISSQYISSLLMAGALTESGIDINLESPLKSAPYVQITQEVLADFNIQTTQTHDGFYVDGNQVYRRADPYSVPGDFSSISYLLAVGAIAGDTTVTITGVQPSAQGDSAIIDILTEMGADIDWNRSTGELTVTRSALAGTTIDVGDTPDLLPTIATLGAIADGTTVIENCEHVRLKETDRVSAMASELSKMGATVSEESDQLTIHGGDSTLTGASVRGYHDHRIIMALSVAALVADGPTVISGAEHVDVSYPSFFTDLQSLGMEYESQQQQ